MDHVYTFTHKYPIPDISFNKLNCLLVDPYDNIFKFTFNPRLKSPSSISQLRHHPYYHQSYDNRFRLIDFNPYDDTAENTCLTANSHSLNLVDFRSPTLTLIHNTPSTITDLQGTSASNLPLTALTTTSHIHFFDIRNYSQSLLSIPHNRDYDRTLSLKTINSPNNTISALLFSANHPLLSIYTIGGTAAFPRSLHAPYAHKLPFAPVGGWAVHQREQEDVCDMYLRSQGGSLTYATLSTNNAAPLHIRTDPAVWSQEVEGYFGEGLASMREYTQRDMTKQWALIVGGSESIEKQPLKEYGSNGLDVKLAGEVQSAQNTQWKYSIPQQLHSPPPTYPYPDDGMASRVVAEQLKQSYSVCSNNRPENITSSSNQIDRSINNNDSNMDTLPTSASNSGGLVHELTRAASAMNIHANKPLQNYSFGALKPTFKGVEGGDDTDNDNGNLNAATNLLLAEWSGDVDTYRYRDPYADSEEEEEGHTLPPLPTQLEPPVSVKKPRRPPVVLSTATPQPQQPLFTTQPTAPNHMLSSPRNHSQPSQPPSSQVHPSTQVEPGRFGGRPANLKKKKKRVGGF